jgi:hypothetical protein
LEYLLETYHRAIYILEKKFKAEYDETYSQVRKVIANYITLIINMPENFDINLPKNKIKEEIIKYYKETEEDELIMLLTDMQESLKDDVNYLSNVFTYFFNIIHEENLKIILEDNISPYDKLSKNLNFLLSLFSSFPITIEAFINDINFLPLKNIQNGNQFQHSTFFSVYFLVCITDISIENLKGIFPVYKTPFETENFIKYHLKRHNIYMEQLLKLIYIIYEYSENSRQALKNWIYAFITFNYDKTKIYQNHSLLTRNGFLCNVLHLILKIIFEGEFFNEFKNPQEYLFYLSKNINCKFTLSDNRIDFKKFERINTDSAKEILETVGNDENNFVEYCINTELFFIGNVLFDYLIKNMDSNITQVSNQLSELQEGNNQGYNSDPK